PLPESFLSKFKTKSESESHHVDNPDEHQGRLRSFKHERGNWASFVSIQYPHDLTDVCNDVIRALEPVGQFHVVEDMHISLSRTVVLLHHWIDALVQDLKSRIYNTFKRFELNLGTLEVYTNDEKSRTFLGIKVDSTEMMNYVHSIDESLKQFELPSFYKNPDFHISVLWCVGDVRKQISANVLNKIQKILADYLKMFEYLRQFEVNELRLKTGNKMFVFPVK
ncbi:hypothetical protein HELRODRAFT_76915, partial [Helobdella robusta]|uniref:U6 snRNA phosphodiesterase n=1 Tax=Helobdella robusta TaxID=6412 RepID=T1G2R1_HELRO